MTSACVHTHAKRESPPFDVKIYENEGAEWAKSWHQGLAGSKVISEAEILYVLGAGWEYKEVNRGEEGIFFFLFHQVNGTHAH